MASREKPRGSGAKTSMGSPQADPQGSYTGVPADPKERPAQDADDL